MASGGQGGGDHLDRPTSVHASSTSALPRSRTDDSWIEVSSRPSSSSLSSAADEIITTGLRVQQEVNARRRRRLRRSGENGSQLAQRTSGTSSQEEYEASESESDRVMSSSNEGIQPSPLQDQWQATGDRALSSASSENAFDDGDADENATAIGVAPSEVMFTPQPNAFTHPSFAGSTRTPQPSGNPYFNTERPSRALNQRHSYPSEPRHPHYNPPSASYPDHDAALRASLSTLLSCAAAARGLPKSSGAPSGTQRRTNLSNRVETGTLCMVSESEMLGVDPAQPHPAAAAQPSAPAPAPRDGADKAKRKAAPPPGARSTSRERRASKKARRASSTAPWLVEDVSPTLLTWVVSAGVVVLVSALSFSAGYVVGREAGRAEAAAGVAEFGSGVRDAGRCGRDYVLEHGGAGLKKLRWAGATTSVRA